MGAEPVNMWGPAYVLGIPSIDAQHKTLFDLAYSIECAVRAGQGQESVEPSLKQMAAYVQTHFAHEEELMTQTQYPGLEAHRAEHLHFSHRIQHLRNENEGRGNTAALQTAIFLKMWIMHHIKEVDREMARHLRRHHVA